MYALPIGGHAAGPSAQPQCASRTSCHARIKSVCKVFKHLILKIMMDEKIAKLKSYSILRTAEGFKPLSKILCLIEKSALFALRLKFFSAKENFPVLETSTPRYL